MMNFEKGQRNYCTSEEELLPLVLALQHFKVYVSAGDYPLIVYTDHNLLVFLHRLKNMNQRLLWWYSPQYITSDFKDWYI